MGDLSYKKYLGEIQVHIKVLTDSVESLERRVKTLGDRVQGGINIKESQARLAEYEAELAKMHTKVDQVKKFSTKIKRWSKLKDCVIGFVVWAPSIGIGNAPHSYTHDFCIIKLYKDRFRHMVGNVLSLGMVLVCLIEHTDLNVPLSQVLSAPLQCS